MKTLNKFLTLLALSSFLVACGDDPEPPVEDIKVSGISLKETSKVLDVDETFTLVASIKPSNATNKNITWSITQNNEYISLNSFEGSQVTVTALKEGSAKVTAKTDDGDFTASCNFTVIYNDPTIHVSGISLDIPSKEIKVDDTFDLVATIAPDNADNKNISWSIFQSDDVLSLSATSGSAVTVTGLKEGNATVIATSEDGGYKATCGVNVIAKVPPVVSVSGISLNESSKEIKVDGAFTLEATIEPSNATNKGVSWSITQTDTFVSISANSGSTVTVTGLKEGTAKVTAKSDDGGFKADCDVTVIAKEVPTVDVTGISLNKNSHEFTVDDTVELVATITPNNATNKGVSWSITQTGTFVSLNKSTGDKVTVTALDEGNATVTAKSDDGNFEASCTFKVNPKVIPTETTKAYIHDENNLIYSIEQKIDGVYTLVTQTGVEDEVTYYVINVDTDIRVKLVSKGDIEVTGLEVNTDKLTIDSDGYVIFNSSSEDYDFFSLTPTYIDHSPKTGEYNFVLVNSTHLTMKLYADKNKSRVVNSADYEDTVYIDVITDDEDYYAESVSIYRKTTDIGSVTSEASYDEESKMFYFKTPYTWEKDKNITLTVKEINGALLKNTDIPGSYFYLWITTSSKQFLEFEKDKVINVDLGGKMERVQNNTVNRSDLIVSYTGDILKTESHHDLIYGHNYIFTSDKETYGFYPPFGDNFDMLCVKKEAATDYASSYKVRGEKITINSTLYVIVNILHNDKEYFSMVIDYTNQKIYEDVSFKFFYGEEITDDKVIYEVYDKDNVLLFGVSYEKDGGVANRIPLISPYGVYEGDLGEFILANDIVGVIGGTSYVAVIDGDTVTLKNATRKIVLSLDTDKYIYTVTSDEEITSKIPDMKGKTFTCAKYWGGWDESYITNTSFVFNNYSSDDDIQVTYTGYGSYHVTFDVIDYDLDTNIITMKIIIDSQPYKWITNEEFTLTAQMADGKMTLLKDLNNVCTFKDAVFECSDFHL